MKMLALDIETAPNTAHVWGLFKQNISLHHIMDTSRVLCFSYKWLGEKSPTEFVSEWQHGREEMLIEAHTLLDKADAVITYNGDSFDLPTLNKEFLIDGLEPPSPYHSIDLYKAIKGRFRFVSNKLDHICEELSLGNKMRHKGHELWVKCMEGDGPAWKVMEKYNKQDVKLLERLYYRMLPWLSSHPNAALYLGGEPTKPTCTNCGSDKVHSRGVQTTKSHSYTRYRCDCCGTWMRSRYTLHKKNPNVLTQAAAT